MADIPSEIPEFKPIFGKVVIRVSNAQIRKVSPNLVAPVPHLESRVMGEIVAVYHPETIHGEEVQPQVEVGDFVLMGQYTGTEISFGREDYIICKEQDLLAVLEWPEGVEPFAEEEHPLRQRKVVDPAGGLDG